MYRYMIFDILKMTLHKSLDMLQNLNQKNHEINDTIKALSIAQRSQILDLDTLHCTDRLNVTSK